MNEAMLRNWETRGREDAAVIAQFQDAIASYNGLAGDVVPALVSEVRRLRDSLKLAMKQVKDGHDRYVCPFCDANLSCVCGKGGTLPHKDNCPMFTPEGEFK
jgi:hypothetical protein